MNARVYTPIHQDSKTTIQLWRTCGKIINLNSLVKQYIHACMLVACNLAGMPYIFFRFIAILSSSSELKMRQNFEIFSRNTFQLHNIITVC
jgi:hypothetical protein